MWHWLCRQATSAFERSLVSYGMEPWYISCWVHVDDHARDRSKHKREPETITVTEAVIKNRKQSQKRQTQSFTKDQTTWKRQKQSSKKERHCLRDRWSKSIQIQESTSGHVQRFIVERKQQSHLQWRKQKQQQQKMAHLRQIWKRTSWHFQRCIAEDRSTEKDRLYVRVLAQKGAVSEHTSPAFMVAVDDENLRSDVYCLHSNPSTDVQSNNKLSKKSHNNRANLVEAFSK